MTPSPYGSQRVENFTLGLFLSQMNLETCLFHSLNCFWGISTGRDKKRYNNLGLVFILRSDSAAKVKRE